MGMNTLFAKLEYLKMQTTELSVIVLFTIKL